MSAGDRLDRDLDALAGQIAHARDDLDAGRPVDLSSFEPTIDGLGARLAQLPGATARAYRQRLLALMDDLGHLAGAIERHLAALKRDLEQSGERRRALSAYGKRAGASGPETKR